MVEPGDTVTNTLKKEFGEEAMNSMELPPEDSKALSDSLEELFHHGTVVCRCIRFCTLFSDPSFVLFFLLTSFKRTSFYVTENITIF